ncbi:MAG: 2-hydroxychromene-2-carboxylate isomerase [Labilithrix sp.]|nr:2-hydroxychromene-2-carboxylate isomerase [Labilithrix sp.]
MPTSVRFFFDYVSPYAYLASTQLPALASRRGVEVEHVPVLFAAMLDASGARGPGEVPMRRDYMFHDIVRLARLFGVPLEPPATHPFNPLVALRVTHGVEDARERRALVDALFRAVWVESLAIDRPEVVANVARGIGLDGDALVDRASRPDAKARLRAATDEAIAARVFGVPTMIASGELFWGVDSLHLLERFLDGADATDPSVIERWRRVAPSASRRAI